MPSYAVVRSVSWSWTTLLKITVIGLARTPSAVQAKLATDDIRNVEVIAADLQNHKSLAAAAATAAVLTNGLLDYLIVNGVHQNLAADFLSPTEFTGREDLLHDYMVKTLEVNVIGVMCAINSFLPLVRKSHIKKIIVITAGLADLKTQRKGNISFFVTYSSLKAALNMVVARYSIELRDEGVVFLVLSPGLVNTQETQPPAEVIPQLGIMMRDIMAANPNVSGPYTPAAPAESVMLQRRVIENIITIEDSGAFLSHLGNKTWI